MVFWNKSPCLGFRGLLWLWQMNVQFQETSNLESNTYDDDDDFKRGSYDDHFE